MSSFALLVAIAPPMGQLGSYSLNLSSIFVLPSGKVSKLQLLRFGLHDEFYGRRKIIIIIIIIIIIKIKAASSIYRGSSI